MFKSIRWRFILIFFIIVLIVITISGVYIIQFFEQNSYQVVESRLDSLAKLILPDLNQQNDLLNQELKVKQLIADYQMLGFREQIYVVANNTVIASSEEETKNSAIDFLDTSLLLKALSGKEAMTISQKKLDNSQVKLMDKSYPIKHNEAITGLLYIRYDLQDTEDTLNKSRMTILQSVGIALVVTMFLSYIIASNITKPINELTQKAFAMSRGDFEQTVDVKSDDEIGKLGEMFNFLNKRLSDNINQLAGETSKLEAIINNSGDGLIAINNQREILHINQPAKQILNLDTQKEYRSYQEITENAPEAFQFSYIINKHPEWRGTELVNIEPFTYQLRFEPFSSESSSKEEGKNGLIIIIEDITERYALENMRRQFVANVSHELKTPITSIKGYTETLLAGAISSPEVATNFLEVINSETDRMTHLVQDLLTLSQFDAKIAKLELKKQSYKDLIEASVNKLTLYSKNKNQRIILALKPVESYFDYHRMEQVMINIISNAIKYTADNGQINISLQADDRKIIIIISDNGIGISEEDKEHLFERFYRVDKGRSRQLGGTGLGLSIAQEIVELHRGKIEVASELNKGTEFTIILPYLDEAGYEV